MKMKRIIAINDISCLGRCSLTVILPVISSCGLECTPLPTSLLSSHTGGLPGYSFLDLSEEIPKITKQWEALNLDAAAIYCGYLASPLQAETVIESIRALRKKDTLVFLDPVMGDHGKLYRNITPEMVEAMEKIAAEADYLLPNLTEAHRLAHMEYKAPPYSREYLIKLLKKLQMLYPKATVILSGVEKDNQIGCAWLIQDELQLELHEKVSVEYHGTGDLFRATLISAIVKGLPLKKALRTAGEFVKVCMVYTAKEQTDERYGVLFEEYLDTLRKRMGEER